MANLYPYYYQNPEGGWEQETREVQDFPGYSPGTGSYQYVAINPDGSKEEKPVGYYRGAIPGQEIWASPTGGEEGGGEEGGGGGEEWPTDLYPKSYSGLPDWASKWVENYFSQYSPQVTGGMDTALKALDNPIALNEAETANLNYMANQNLKPILSDLSSKGVLSSSVSSDSISKILSQLGSTAYDKAQANQQNKVNSYQKAMAIMQSLLGESKYSESTNQWAPYGDLMDYLATMSLAG
jgi:hypothetical protein